MEVIYPSQLSQWEIPNSETYKNENDILSSFILFKDFMVYFLEE